MMASSDVFGGHRCDCDSIFKQSIKQLATRIAAHWDSLAEIADCKLWGNHAGDLDESFGGECSTKYSCIEDKAPGESNIDDDPMFVPGPFGDYYLDPDSPCIDAGSRSAEEAGLIGMTTQADGEPDTGTVDMGFHYPVP